MTESGASDDGAAVVPLALLDDLLESVAGLLHDRPVQSLVAARLLVETALGSDQRSDMLDRGVQAITGAGEEARDVMWALAGVSLRPGHLAEDVSDAMARLAAPDQAVQVTVRVDDDIPWGLMRLAVQAVHDVLIELMRTGGHVRRVHLISDAEALQVAVHCGPARAVGDDSPWVRLARLRLRTAAGRLTHHIDGDAHVVDISLPLQVA